ncbi:hypothetical protein [Kaarinaea lacus]
MLHTSTGSAMRTTLISVFAIAVFLAVAFMLLPKGFSGDTSIIGQGSNVAVLAHNKDSVQSLNLMEYMNQVRNDYAGKVEFVVADANTPQGRAFIQSQQVELGTLLLFASNGTRLQVVSNIDGQSKLRSVLDTAFNKGG